MSPSSNPPAEYIVEQLSTVVVPGLLVALRMFDDYAAGYPASTSDAPPSTSRPAPVDDPCVGGPPVRLSRLEADASRPDRVRRDEVRLDAGVDLLIEYLTVALTAAGSAPGRRSTTRRLRGRLLYAVWLATHLRRVPAQRGAVERAVTAAVREVDFLANICDAYREPERPSLVVDLCRSHERAGLEAGVAPRYARLRLCRWCGEELATHGDLPDPKLVELHDRGIRISPSIRDRIARQRRDEARSSRRKGSQSSPPDRLSPAARRRRRLAP